MFVPTVIVCLSVPFSVLSVPINPEQIATRDIPVNGLPQSKNDLKLERQLQAKVNTETETKDTVSKGGNGKIQPEVNAPAVSAISYTENLPINQQPSGIQTDENGRSLITENDAEMQDGPEESVSTSEEEDLAISEAEEEILRTVIMTLRDNPELIKVLLDSDIDDMSEEDFDQQKAAVSDSQESWGNFQQPSPHLAKIPKTIEKKSGDNLPKLYSNSRSRDALGGQFLRNDGVIQLPVNTGGRESLDEKEIQEDLSNLEHGNEHPEALSHGKQKEPSRQDVRGVDSDLVSVDDIPVEKIPVSQIHEQRAPYNGNNGPDEEMVDSPDESVLSPTSQNRRPVWKEDIDPVDTKQGMWRETKPVVHEKVIVVTGQDKDKPVYREKDILIDGFHDAKPVVQEKVFGIGHSSNVESTDSLIDHVDGNEPSEILKHSTRHGTRVAVNDLTKHVQRPEEVELQALSQKLRRSGLEEGNAARVVL